MSYHSEYALTAVALCNTSRPTVLYIMSLNEMLYNVENAETSEKDPSMYYNVI